MKLDLKQKQKINKWIENKTYDKVIDYYVKENIPYCLELPFTKINLNFVEQSLKCLECGRCCHEFKNKKNQHIELLDGELKRIAKFVYMKEDTFKEVYCKKIKGKWKLKLPCKLYLKFKQKCNAYSARPIACRMFPLQNPKKIKFKGMTYLAITLFPHCPAVRNFLTEQWFPGLPKYKRLIQEELRKQKI